MFYKKQCYTLGVGPFIFSVETDIGDVKKYINTHYEKLIIPYSPDQFTDYKVGVCHGPLYRRIVSPQAIFTINYTPPFSPLPLDQAHAFLEWGMNWSITRSAHQYFIIHAATLELNGKAVIITAPPGSGKSTLAALLASKGWRLLSDELALVTPEADNVYGLFRPINLKNQSISLMEKHYDKSEFSRQAHDTHKGSVCLLKPTANSTMHLKAAKPSTIVFISYNPDEKYYEEEICKSKALMEVAKNSFNFGLLGQKGFHTLKALIEKTSSYYIEYNDSEKCEQRLRNLLIANDK